MNKTIAYRQQECILKKLGEKSFLECLGSMRNFLEYLEDEF